VRVVTLSGVDKAAYLAEYAVGVGVGTNANHAGFTGTGFVDSFDQAGDSVTFSIHADASGAHLLRFRYANALGMPATRTVSVDGQVVGTLTLPALSDWDTWSTADIATTLTRGRHQVQIACPAANIVPINLDGLTLVQTDVQPRGPALRELHYLGGPATAWSANQIVDYTGFFRDEDGGLSYTQVGNFHCEAWFEHGAASAGVLTTNYLTYHGATVQPRCRISRSYAAVPDQPDRRRLV
jgi:hypothetical protein